VHYVLKEKHWGHGYCSEFVKALLEMWWNLPRDEREVDCPTMLYTGDSEQKELLIATPLPGNSRSKKVLEKAGFHFRGLLDGREVWSATSNNEH
jgi:RimJ/RimL family protein N-acetyltransferase